MAQRMSPDMYLMAVIQFESKKISQLGAGMEGLEGFGEVALADVGVAICGGDVGMAQHLLDDPQVRAVF